MEKLKFEEIECKPSPYVLSILQLIAEGYSYKEIGKRLGKSNAALCQVVYYAVRDNKLRGRIPLVIYAIRKGWIKG